MPPSRHQQSAWQTRNPQPSTNAPTSSSSSSAAAPAATTASASSASSAPQSSKVPAHRWNNVVRFDSKVPVSPPTSPEAVTPPPPPNAYRGGRHHHQQHQSNDNQSKDTAATASPESPTVKYVCNVTVTLKDAGMQNSDTPRLVRIMDEQLFSRPQNDPPDTVYFISLDVSGNNLSCEAIQHISKWFVSKTRYARLRNLKVFKNSVSDDGALALATLITNQCTALEELHLSHNDISATGASALFKAFGEAKTASGASKSASSSQQGPYVYPRYDSIRGAQLPVWIRLEYNKILETYALLQKWEVECKATRGLDGNGYRLTCFADRPNQPHGNKDPHCSPARCVRSGPNHSPLLHLYSFHHQFSTPPNTSAPQTPSTSRTAEAPALRGSKPTNGSPTPVRTYNQVSTGKPADSQPSKSPPQLTKPTIATATPAAGGGGDKSARTKRGPQTSGGGLSKPGGGTSAATDASVSETRVSGPSKVKADRRSPQHQQQFGPGDDAPKKQTTTAAAPPTSARDMKEEKRIEPTSIQSASSPETSQQQHQQQQAQEREGSQHSNAPSGTRSPTWEDSAVIDIGNVRKAPQYSGAPQGGSSVTAQEYSVNEIPPSSARRSEAPAESPTFGRRSGAHQVPPTSRTSEMDYGRIDGGASISMKPDDLFGLAVRNAPTSSAPSSRVPNGMATSDQLLNLHGGSSHLVDSLRGRPDMFSRQQQQQQPQRPYQTASYYSDAAAQTSPVNQLHHRGGVYDRSELSGARESDTAGGMRGEPLSSFRGSGVPTSPPPTASLPSSVPSGFPLYIFLDASAFSDMRLVSKKDKFNPFSFPAIYSLCQKKAFCHSSMTGPIIRRNMNGDEIERLDASHSLILMAVNSMADGLAAMTESKPFLRNALLELDDDFIKPLMDYGVIENLDDTNSTNPHGNGWMMYTNADLEKALSLGVSLASLKVLDFALVWAHHLSKVSPTSSLKGPSHASFAIFLTSSPNVEQFFAYLMRRHLANADESLSGRSGISGGGGMTNRGMGGGDSSSCHLVCVNLDQLNQLLRDHCPSMTKIFDSPHWFEPSLDQPQSYSTTTEILSAKTIERLLFAQRRDLLTIDASKLGVPPPKIGSHDDRHGGSPFDEDKRQQQRQSWWVDETAVLIDERVRAAEHEITQLKSSLQSVQHDNQVLRSELRRASGLIEELVHRLKFTDLDHPSGQTAKSQYRSAAEHQQQRQQQQRVDVPSLIMQTETELDRFHQLLLSATAAPQTTTMTTTSSSGGSMDLPPPGSSHRHQNYPQQPSSSSAVSRPSEDPMLRQHPSHHAPLSQQQQSPTTYQQGSSRGYNSGDRLLEHPQQQQRQQQPSQHQHSRSNGVDLIFDMNYRPSNL